MADSIDPEVIRAMRRFRTLLDQRETATMMEMAQHWARLERGITGHLDGLVAEIAERQARGQIVTADMIRLSKRYQELQAQVRDQVVEYADWAAGKVTAEQRWMAKTGLDHAAAMLRAGFPRTAFNVLPVEALKLMAGYVADGSPLRAYFTKMYPAAMQGIMDALMTGMARGWGPAKTARLMRDALGVAPRTAILSARTETLRVYRESSLQQYRASGIVDGYIRVAAKSERTCMACLAKDGEWFPLTESFAEHPAGRCRTIPALKGQQYPGTQGLDWFIKQPEERQRLMLGPGRYEAWKANKFDLTDIAKLHKDPTWGNAWQERGLKELVGGNFVPARPSIDISKLELGKFGNLKEAEVWCTANYPHIKFDFTGAHIDTINPTIKQFDMLAKQYPEVAARLENVGTRAQLGANAKGWDGSASVFAHATTDGKLIGLNPRWYGNPSEFLEMLKAGTASGWNPPGCDTYASVLTHEFGHQVSNWLLAQQGAFVPVVRYSGGGLVSNTVFSWQQSLFNKASKISLYAKTNAQEAWAEAFASMYHTPARHRVQMVRDMPEALRIITGTRYTDYKYKSDVTQAEWDAIWIDSGLYDKLAKLIGAAF